ncbi:MAG: 30S ribosomal protein S9 [Planctomycetes bacterium DG_23]|nr:MAG: 30S ribosomal protein S9 [Planctomycetes bacterium DG_23]
MTQEVTYHWGTGRRKTSVARVRLRLGNGTILINGRELDDYFTEEKDRQLVRDVFRVSKTQGHFDCLVNVNGGGYTGQAGAVVLGIARALVSYDSSLTEPLREAGFLTRDPRMTERKKYGRRGARRGFQWAKR